MKSKLAMIAAIVAIAGLSACAQQEEEVVVPVEPEPVSEKF
ncbi:MAG: hypothetical protein AAGA28_07795 [Pseudomonadota bacterium]